MKLWHLTRKDSAGWDEYSDTVVRADTEQEARSMMEANAGWEKYEPIPRKNGAWFIRLFWTDPLLTDCVELTSDGPAEIICASYHAG